MSRTKKELGVASSALLLATGTANGLAFAADSPANDCPQPAAQENVLASNAALQAPSVVNGVFMFSQCEVSTLDAIHKALHLAPKYLCGAEVGAGDSTETSPENWTISVGGDVANGFSATIDELAQGGRAQVIMGCSCAGNPAGGPGTVNAETTGVTLRSIMERAGVSAGANTVVFTSEDGYEAALPLSYVKNRYAMIVYAVNGQPMSNSVGGSNQLWLGATSAQYYVRNVASISFETRQTPPPVPGSAQAADAAANMPSASITAAETQA